MPLESQKAELLRGYKVFPMPNNPSLRVDTENEAHWVLVTKEILLMLADELVKQAKKMELTN